MAPDNSQDELRGKSDHDLIIMTVTELAHQKELFGSQLSNVEKLLGNHLVHSDKREMLYLTVIIGSVGTVMLSLAGILYTVISAGS